MRAFYSEIWSILTFSPMPRRAGIENKVPPNQQKSALKRGFLFPNQHFPLRVKKTGAAQARSPLSKNHQEKKGAGKRWRVDTQSGTRDLLPCVRSVSSLSRGERGVSLVVKWERLGRDGGYQGATYGECVLSLPSLSSSLKGEEECQP